MSIGTVYTLATNYLGRRKLFDMDDFDSVFEICGALFVGTVGGGLFWLCGPLWVLPLFSCTIALPILCISREAKKVKTK
jgi:hypothetical protein